VGTLNQARANTASQKHPQEDWEYYLGSERRDVDPDPVVARHASGLREDAAHRARISFVWTAQPQLIGGKIGRNDLATTLYHRGLLADARSLQPPHAASRGQG
jgi:hypothetical protein